MINIKTKEDIAILREGGKRHAYILKELAKMVKPGLHVIDLDTCATELIKEGGDSAAFLNYQPYGAQRAYPATLCVSINDEIVHGIPTEGDKVLKEGDIVSIDLGLVHKQLITDAAITVPVGKISAELEQLLQATKSALMAGIKAAKEGVKVGVGLGPGVMVAVAVGAAAGSAWQAVMMRMNHAPIIFFDKFMQTLFLMIRKLLATALRPSTTDFTTCAQSSAQGE